MKKQAPSFTVQELANLTGAKAIGNLSHQISSVAPLESAQKQSVTFFANQKYLEALQHSNAGLICISPEAPTQEGKNYLISNNPSVTFQKIAQLLLPKPPSAFTGIHPTAVVHESVELAPHVCVGPYAVIDQGCEIGEGTYIEAFVAIGPGVTIGKECHLYPHVTIREGVKIGNRVILQPGAVIGSCGYGYATDGQGKHKKLEQLGIVSIQDDVEIGANTTIDRARFGETIIGEGSKLDNLVQIGHNTQIGKQNLIISQVGIAGSVKTGRNVVLGGQVGVAGHLEIGDFSNIAAKAGISKSLQGKESYAGVPATKISEHYRNLVNIKTITHSLKEIKTLKEKIEQLEKELSSLKNG